MTTPSPLINPVAVRSEFANDPEFSELLQLFVESLNDKVATLRSLYAQGKVDEIGILSHQVKGAAGGYGFPELSAAAAQLEQSCRAGSDEPITRSLGQFLEYVGRIEI